MGNDKENIIVGKTFDFALQIIDYSEELKEHDISMKCAPSFLKAGLQ